jgi:hypothetical protein
VQTGKASPRVLEAVRLHDILAHGFDRSVGVNTYNALLSVFTKYALGR